MVLAKAQPQYRQLPALRTADGVVVSRWRLTWRERLTVLLRGHLWLSMMTFGAAPMPVLPQTDEPDDVMFARLNGASQKGG